MQTTGAAPSTKKSVRDKIFRKLTNGTLGDPIISATTDRSFAKLAISGMIGRDVGLPTDAILRSEAEVAEFDFQAHHWVRTTHAHVLPIQIAAHKTVPKDQIESWLTLNYYRLFREANYKHLKPGILVEPFVRNAQIPLEVRALCFDGQVSLLHTFDGREGLPYAPRRYYTPDWQVLDFSVWDPADEKDYDKPANIQAFLDDCAKVAQHFEIIGLEALFYPDGSYYFIGLSHCPDGGLHKVHPASKQQEYNDRFLRLPPYGDTPLD